MTDMSALLPEEPVLSELWRSIFRASLVGGLANIILSTMTVYAMVSPAVPLDAIVTGLLQYFGFGGEVDRVLAASIVFACLLLLSAFIDLIVHFHGIHDAAQEFVERNHVCRTVARLINRFGMFTVEVEGQKTDLRDWADNTLENTKIEGYKGRSILFLGILFFAIAGLLPWLVASDYLGEPQWWLLAVVIKVPLLSITIWELLLIAIRPVVRSAPEAR